MSAPLADRTVLVTGGSRGIGRAVVEAVHRDGAHVIVHSSRVKTGRAVREALGPERAHAVAGDLADVGVAAQVWAGALAWRRRIDVLVNNAGAWLASPLDDEASWDYGWAGNLALNLLAPATLCRLAIGHFRSSGGGVIVNVTSRSAHRGDDADHLAYGAAKGGLLALTKGIARLRPRADPRVRRRARVGRDGDRQRRRRHRTRRQPADARDHPPADTTGADYVR